MLTDLARRLSGGRRPGGPNIGDLLQRRPVVTAGQEDLAGRVVVSGSTYTHRTLFAHVAKQSGAETQQPAGGTGVAVLGLDPSRAARPDYRKERMKFR